MVKDLNSYLFTFTFNIKSNCDFWEVLSNIFKNLFWNWNNIKWFMFKKDAQYEYVYLALMRVCSSYKKIKKI